MRSRLLPLIISAAILSACAMPPPVTQTAPPPLIAVAVSTSASELPIDAAVEGWETYRDSDTGLSFAYPPGSVVERDSIKPPWYTLFVPAADFPDGNAVSIGIANYDLPDGMPLETWLDMYHALGESQEQVKMSRWDIPGVGGADQPGLAVEIRPSGAGVYAIYLVHGNLVLRITGPGTPAMRRFLPALVSTIQFDAGAPNNLDELLGAAHGQPALQDVYATTIAAQSVTPPLDIVVRDATAAAQITPGPSVTYTPEMQTVEAAFYQSLETATAVAGQTPPTATATPIPTSTPMPAGRPGYALYRGSSGYQERPQFELTYDMARWSLESDERIPVSSLRNQQLPGCLLDLRAGGRGMGGPMVVDWPNLGGYQWRRTAWLAQRLVAYALELDEGNYLFEARYPADASQDAVSACRAAADKVLETFRLLD